MQKISLSGFGLWGIFSTKCLRLSWEKLRAGVPSQKNSAEDVLAPVNEDHPGAGVSGALGTAPVTGGRVGVVAQRHFAPVCPCCHTNMWPPRVRCELRKSICPLNDCPDDGILLGEISGSQFPSQDSSL